MQRLFIFCFIVVGLTYADSSVTASESSEVRAFWVDAWHDGFQNNSQVNKLVSDVRAANCNTIFVQVRKRGDAYYRGSPYEPASEVVTAGFDPLGDIIQKAHDTNLGPRLEVHAWFVVYPVSAILRDSNGLSVTVGKSDPNHPLNRHPEWLMRSENGATLNGTDYSFDPGIPEVQEYLFNVAMDIISRYDIDGFHLDHVCYPDAASGYNKASIMRFDALFHRTDKPRPRDLEWSQFRRDQVTALVRKIYLSAIAVKPFLKISAATVTSVPGIMLEAQWQNSAPYKDSFEDWNSWMREGILDMNVPMVFFKESGSLFSRAYRGWCNFAKDHKYNRQVIIGQAAFLNSVPASLMQIRGARAPSMKGTSADGMALYSYAVPTSNENERRRFFASGVTNGVPEAKAIFSSYVPVPEMAWKTKPTEGYVMGYISGGLRTNVLDGATVLLNGPVVRTLKSDATGFFGAVGLPPGSYTEAASFSGFASQSKSCVVAGGLVQSNRFLLEKQ
jgi:uncharacterized lipoprotein YddW (UPF0748 family)